MKHYKLFQNYLILTFSLIAFCIFISCTKDDDFNSNAQLNEDVIFKQENSNIVSLADAKSIANSVFKTGIGKYSKGGKKKNIENITPVGSNPETPSYYIINYENGGFLILSGDKRAYPILAFSDEDNFEVKNAVYPDLLVNWLKAQDNYISEVRKDTLKDISSLEKLWSINEIENFITSTSIEQKNQSTPIATKSYCSSQPLGQPILIATHGPLLSTSWGQGVGFNNLAPNYGCSNYSNGRTPTGCVATSMSQIMRYYQHPNNYNWSIMPNVVTGSNSSSSGANEISRLMRDAGNSVNMIGDVMALVLEPMILQMPLNRVLVFLLQIMQILI